MASSTLADQVLPLIRTRADLHRYHASNAHGTQMHGGVDILEQAMAGGAEPAVVLAVTEKAIASALKVIMRADDSAGIIGDACRRLIDLHPVAAAAAPAQADRLVDWMIRFQFDNDCDFFVLDPVAYAPALGETGVARYRRRLDEIRSRLGPEPGPRDRWRSEHSHDWFTLQHQDQRLAVLDHDVDAIIRTHAKDGSVAAWVHDAATALEEIGEIDLAIEWAQRAAETPGGGHQSLTAGQYWCDLLAAHRPDEVLAACLGVFRRWPSSSTAAQVHAAAGTSWPDHHDEVLRQLADRPGDAVDFALGTLGDTQLAWQLAHQLLPTDAATWTRLAAAYETVDPAAVLPVLAQLVDGDLETADARQYRSAARRLTRMRRLAAGLGREGEVLELVAELRQAHRRRPRLQREFDRAGLP